MGWGQAIMASSTRRGGQSPIPPEEKISPTSQEDPPRVIRVVHQNVNGINNIANFNEVGLVLGKVVENEIDIFTLNEVNVNLQDKSIRSEYHNAYRSKHKQCVLQSAWAPTEIAAKRSRPGGNQGSIFGPLKSCIKEKAFDKIAGTWSSITVHTKRQPLTIISSYRVSQSSIKGVGERTVYSQEYMALEADGVHNPEPRTRCLQELTKVVHSHVEKGHMVLLNLDANEDIADHKQLHDFSTDLNLVDLVATFSPNQCNTATYKRGRKRIDYSFCTHDLLEYVVSAKVADGVQVKESDHRAVEILLDHSKLMKKAKQSHRPTPRQVSQKNPASVRRYQDLVEKYFKDHDLFRRVEMVESRLDEEPDMDDDLKTELLNQLDEEKTRYLLAAERKCSKKRKYAIYQWSPLLAQAG
jgi:exonuclease III